MVTQDIDQPIFGKGSKLPQWVKRLILGLVVAISVATILFFSLKNAVDLPHLEPEGSEKATPTIVPTETSSSSGELREKWQKINKELEKIDPRQKLLQPPKLDFN